MDLLVIVHIKSSYDGWKTVFDSFSDGRENFSDDSRTRVAKVDDNTAMVQLFDVDMQKMTKAINDPNSSVQDAMEDHVVSREIFKVEKMTPPGP